MSERKGCDHAVVVVSHTFSLTSRKQEGWPSSSIDANEEQVTSDEAELATCGGTAGHCTDLARTATQI